MVEVIQSADILQQKEKKGKYTEVGMYDLSRGRKDKELVGHFMDATIYQKCDICLLQVSKEIVKLYRKDKGCA